MERRRARVRIARQQEHRFIGGRFLGNRFVVNLHAVSRVTDAQTPDVRTVHAGVGHDVSATMLGDEHAVAVGDDLVRLSEHDLHHARVLAEGGGQLGRARRRLPRP